MSNFKSPKLYQALKQLTILHPFWATLALHMEFVDESPEKCPTFGVDGKRIIYNVKFAESLSLSVLMFVIAHECAHVFLHHIGRMHQPRPGDGRIYGHSPTGKPYYWQPMVYNVAGDHVINNMLKQIGFDLWKSCLCDPKYSGWKTEAVYNDLMKNPHPPPPPPPNGPGTGSGGQGQPTPSQETGGDSGQHAGPKTPSTGSGSGQPTGSGKPQPYGDINTDKITGSDLFFDQAPHYSESEVKEIVQKAAAIAKSQGKMPAALGEMVKEATEPQYPVYTIIERFTDANIRDEDQSWARPKKTLLPYGIVLPSNFNEKISDVTIVLDTSGSVPSDDLSRFLRITGDIMRKLSPMLVRIMCCDAAVSKQMYELKRNDIWPTDFKVGGRGGTDFRPPFHWLEEKQIKPSCLIYLTDMCGPFPDKAPLYPVLWVSTEKDIKAPFGLTVHLNQ